MSNVLGLGLSSIYKKIIVMMIIIFSFFCIINILFHPCFNRRLEDPAEEVRARAVISLVRT